MKYVDYRLDKVSPIKTALLDSEVKDYVFIKDWNGKKIQLKRGQVVKIYEPKVKP